MNPGLPHLVRGIFRFPGYLSNPTVYFAVWQVRYRLEARVWADDGKTRIGVGILTDTLPVLV